MENKITGKNILVIGGAGSLGSELIHQLAGMNNIFVLDTNETSFFNLVEEERMKGNSVAGRVGDIRNRQTVEDVFFYFKPEIVFHLAALKHVTPSEQFPREVVETNLIGLCNVVDTAKKYNVKKLIFTSSDKAVSRDTIYGVSKRMGEIIVRNAGYISIRFANLLGSSGSCIPIWEKAIKENRPITVTDERMERYFWTIEEACYLIIYASLVGQSGDLIILDTRKKKVNILELAKKIIQESGKDIKIEMIGIRPGEQLTEELMTEGEKSIAKKVDDFFVISYNESNEKKVSKKMS